jgi:hypothetical protein
LYIGGFVPHAMDARGGNDVLFNNSAFLSTLNSVNGIDMGEFHGFTFGGEWLVGLNRFLEAGAGIGFYQKAATTVYTNQVNSNGTEIAQELKLRIVPISATIRLLPLGHRAPVQPYVGGGVGIFLWRYSETGQWVASPAPSQTREYPSRKCGCSRATWARKSPPSAFSSIRTHRANGRGPSIAASQMSPFPSWRKSRRANPACDASCM